MACYFKKQELRRFTKVSVHDLKDKMHSEPSRGQYHTGCSFSCYSRRIAANLQLRGAYNALCGPSNLLVRRLRSSHVFFSLPCRVSKSPSSISAFAHVPLDCKVVLLAMNEALPRLWSCCRAHTYHRDLLVVMRARIR